MKRTDLYESIEKQVLAEKVYRNKIRKQLDEIKLMIEEKSKKQQIVEKIYRAWIRSTLSEAKKERMIHKSTGMNALEDLFGGSNLLKTLESDYKILTTSFEQRKDYKGEIMSLILGIFEIKEVVPEKDKDSLNESLKFLFEQEDADIQIQVSDEDEDLPKDKIVGPLRDEMEKEEEEQGKEDDDNVNSIDPEQDLTGKNRATIAFNKIRKSIVDAYNSLGNPADRQEFKIYLIANLKMYFKQWERSLSPDPDPEIPEEADQAVKDAEAELDNAGASEDFGTEGAEGDEEGDDLGLDGLEL